MSPIAKNHKLLRPFFGIPAHNSKVLQILYPLFSLILIVNAIKIILERYHLKQKVSPLLKGLLSELPYVARVLFAILMYSSQCILAILCLVSFVRVIVLYKKNTVDGKTEYVFTNWNNKIKHTSSYSKVNDLLYWFGSFGAILSCGCTIYNIISNDRITDIEVLGEVLSADKIIIFISAVLLIIALLMSLISTFIPSLTEPQSFVGDATAKEQNYGMQKGTKTA